MMSTLSGYDYGVHKLLVANRGEIAVRIIRTARLLGLRTIAVYTQVDATSPHVILADEAVSLSSSSQDSGATESDIDLNADSKGYLDIMRVVQICEVHGATLVHPGYGFLAENPVFARLLEEKGVCLLGPSSRIVEYMGFKHRARTLAVQAQVPIVPGSDGLVASLDEAVHVAERIGYPVMLKATAGGGGMGLVVCKNTDELRLKLSETQKRAQTLFHNGAVFLEKFFDASRHIEVQIFGNGCGHVIHMGERECSVQRRHQKIIEEAPSPYLMGRPDLRRRICEAAVRLGELINYGSAGTVEFLVDEKSGNFYFLEMNTRLQVEHGVTEAIFPGLDIVGLMIAQGVCEHTLTRTSSRMSGLPPSLLQQARYNTLSPTVHAIEARVYCENPANDFTPSPGVLQYVHLPMNENHIRIDSWVSTGLTISPYYDPLIAKVIVTGDCRSSAISKLKDVLLPEALVNNDTKPSGRASVLGPPTNIPFLYQILCETVFVEGKATTEWVDQGGVTFVPSAFTVVSPGINATVQALPTRDIGLGIPPSGPMDPLSFQAGNIIVGNSPECEGLELVIPPTSSGYSSGTSFIAIFHARAVIAVTGAPASVQVDGQELANWAAIEVPAGSKVHIGGPSSTRDALGGGLRAYLLFKGGFPAIPEYLGSKATSLGIGGYQGRALQKGDHIMLRPVEHDCSNPGVSVPRTLVPMFPSEWTLFSLPGPHDDTEFLTSAGIESFYARKWRVASASNRMGIRLEPAQLVSDYAGSVIDWARKDGGEGGSHPSNILDNGYARGSVNLNGDTPVILTNEGPSMGGYLCVATIATADQWKLGQLRPGDIMQFQRISIRDARTLREHTEKWLKRFSTASEHTKISLDLMAFSPGDKEYLQDPKLHVIPATAKKDTVVFRQAGDAAILVEYGKMALDLLVRGRIHAFEMAIRSSNVTGIIELAPCIRSTMVHFDSNVTTQKRVLASIIEIEQTLPEAYEDMTFPGRKISFPIVLDDKWNREALQRYMRSTRDRAVYLPSNVEYLANNNGLEGGSDGALKLLVASPWLVLGVGFYLACPFLVPIDPRCRLVGQKMNPSRTYTPKGAVGIAGVVAAIYPVESPGGYQLFGRTLPTWQGWGNGVDFAPDKPWLLQAFDHVVFEPVSEQDYLQCLSSFESGRYQFKIENIDFAMKEYMSMVRSVQNEIAIFEQRKRVAVKLEEAKEILLLKEWEENKKNDMAPSSLVDDSEGETEFFASTSLSGTLWQLKVKLGEIVYAADQPVAVIEAMKTEIEVLAGDENVGLQVVAFGRGVQEGKSVQAGQNLVFFSSRR